MKILVINGPNLNLLGKRDPSQYGTLTLDMINEHISAAFNEHSFSFIQSNSEGEIIDAIQSASRDLFEAIIINPGGYAHTSVAIRDALADSKLIKVEVHLSHIAKRDDFRQVLITSQGCDGYISGFKEKGYLAAVFLINEMVKK